MVTLTFDLGCLLICTYHLSGLLKYVWLVSMSILTMLYCQMEDQQKMESFIDVVGVTV